MRFIYVIAAVGLAIAVLFITPDVLMGAPSAQADTGINGYLRCVHEAGLPPRQLAEDWLPTIRAVESGLNSGESPGQVAQNLVSVGFKPNDAVAQVQCVLANDPSSF